MANPRKNKLTHINEGFLEGRTKSIVPAKDIDPRAIIVNISLYLGYRSSTSPKTTDPITPLTMNIAPNKPFSSEV